MRVIEFLAVREVREGQPNSILRLTNTGFPNLWNRCNRNWILEQIDYMNNLFGIGPFKLKTYCDHSHWKSPFYCRGMTGERSITTSAKRSSEFRTSFKILSRFCLYCFQCVLHCALAEGGGAEGGKGLTPTHPSTDDDYPHKNRRISDEISPYIDKMIVINREETV
jgi:hypothetical protein